MTVPTYDTLIHPLLRVLAQRDEPIRARDARAELAAELRLPQSVLEELLPSGAQSIFDNRTGWAHDRLKRAGLSTSAKRGYWQLTDEGRRLLARFPDDFPPTLLTEIARPEGTSKVPKGAAGADPTPGPDDEPAAASEVKIEAEAATRSPRERLEAAYQDMQNQLASELLEQVRAVDPNFFEKLVLDLLHAMGYGVTRRDLRQVGQSGDGGIDGIVNLDQLGLQKVYVQAKRWNGTAVGRPEIQAFYGALAERRATYGIYITTSTFSKPARVAAYSLSDSLVLIDGERLVRLMIDHNVGVSQVEVFKVKRLDSDYFADE